MIDDVANDAEFGPAMAALNERQRRFVIAMIEHPGCTQGKAAELAGYSTSSDVYLRKTGHALAHDERILAAINEEAGKRMRSAAILAAGVLIDIAGDGDASNKDRMKAAGMLLDRTGFGAAQTINVNKTVTDRTGAGMLERIKALASQHGLDPAKLLGVNTAPVVDGEFSEVEPAGE
jgi:phage terminase small subunit